MSEIIKEFSEITNAAEKINARTKDKRFIIMTNGRNNKLTEVGIYDSRTKKYALTDVRAHNATEVVKEMRGMLSK